MATAPVLPTADAPLVDTKMGRITRAWYLPILSLFQPAPESSIAVGGSPFSFTATSAGSLLVMGGAVSQITLKRNQVYVTGVVSGFIPVSNGDVLVIAFTVPPTLVFFPR